MFLKQLALLGCLTFVSVTRGYVLIKEYSGESFFDDWTYYGFIDNLTFGNVNYVDSDTAVSDGLTYISDQNTAVIRVDNYTTVPFNGTRNSVRITTNDFYDLGSLWIFDAIHLPFCGRYLIICCKFGCSVWPAWWSKGPNWPEDGSITYLPSPSWFLTFHFNPLGEIDIIENINNATHNQMALHTTTGCFHTTPPGQPGTSGSNPDCSPGSGCVVGDPDPRSWGQAFAAAGGGVWATQFDYQGIFIWFWSRADLPPTLSASAPVNQLDISAWGPPTASYLATTCNISQFFTPQQLVLNIDLCGDWAGVPNIYANTCASQAPNDPTNPISSQKPHTPSCYADNVVGPGQRFDDAYFEINHIRAYTTAATVSPTATTSSDTGVAGNRAPPNTGMAQRLAILPVALAACIVVISAGLLII
ncbi:glycoside hydrolase family 16 protein [Ramaria rubella]|nr:glycoside hydrolase family 16 protein [Ramaria rubella]